MALKTFRPNIAPSPGTSFAPQVKVLEAEFGDGYSQPTPNGINNVRQTAKLKWSTLTIWQKREIVEFFEARRGAEPFYYRPSGFNAALKWTCKEWESSNEGGYWSVSATLVQSFTNLS